MDDTIIVTDIPDKHRYEITVNGEHAGMELYKDTGNERIFYHTVIDDAFSGRGLAGQLVQAAVDQAAAAGLRIVPVCPYVKAWLGKHTEQAEKFTKLTSKHLALLG